MSTPAAARFFHGTVAELSPGDILLPGAEIGLSHHGRSVHVYATTTDFDLAAVDWAAEDDSAEARLALAIGEAEVWAAYAADGACPDPRHTDSHECTCQTGAGNPCLCERPANEFHAQSQVEGLLPSCLRVYEIEPLGPVERDLSTDVDAGVRMGRARVVARVDAPPAA